MKPMALWLHGDSPGVGQQDYKFMDSLDCCDPNKLEETSKIVGRSFHLLIFVDRIGTQRN